MDINTQNSSGMMNGMPPTPQTEKKIGPIVGTLIIVLVLIIAALYFFAQRLNTQYPTSAELPSQTPMTASVTQSDDTTSLQADLDNQLKDVDYSF